MTELRDIVISEITHAARHDHKIMFLASDFGAPALDEFRRDLPDQFLSVGIAEQNMIDVAAGLALSGRKVFCYAMAPFITGRCWEQIKCSLSSMNLPVVLIGVGAGLGYDRVSMTHLAVEDLAIMRAINHLSIWTPSDPVSAQVMVQELIEFPKFCYLRLERGTVGACFDRQFAFPESGLSVLRQSQTRVMLVASGSMVRVAIAASHNWGHGVLDVQIVKPLDAEALSEIIKDVDVVVTVEEHIRAGGLGSALLESLSRYKPYRGLVRKIHCLAIADGFEIVNGDRQQLRRRFSIDATTIHALLGETFMDPTDVAPGARSSK